MYQNCWMPLARGLRVSISSCRRFNVWCRRYVHIVWLDTGCSLDAVPSHGFRKICTVDALREDG